MAVQVGGSVDLSELDKTLATLGHEVKDLRPVFRRIDVDLTGHLREQWPSRGAHLGTPWKPITPATIRVRIAQRMMTARARKRASGAAGRDTPLYDSGGLFASYTKPGAPGSVRLIEPMNYERGSGYNVDGFPVAMAIQQGFNSTRKPVFDRHGDVVFIKRKGGPKAVAPRRVIPTEIPAPILSVWEGFVTKYIETGTVA